MRGVIFIGALRYLYIENLHKNITHIAANSIGNRKCASKCRMLDTRSVTRYWCQLVINGMSNFSKSANQLSSDRNKSASACATLTASNWIVLC
jgi:hypothetical protein